MLRPRRGLVGRGMGVGQGQEPDWMLERVSCRLLFFILFQFLFFSFFLFFFFSFFCLFAGRTGQESGAAMQDEEA